MSSQEETAMKLSYCARHNEQALLIAAFVLISYAYFYAGSGANQNSRFDLLRAIIERHTFSIDAYHMNTMDKAFWNGHFYCDKAPGQSFAAVPIVAGTRAAIGLVGLRSE